MNRVFLVTLYHGLVKRAEKHHVLAQECRSEQTIERHFTRARTLEDIADVLAEAFGLTDEEKRS